MNIEVNGSVRSIPSNSTVGMLLKEMNLSGRAAVFVNGRRLLMKEYDTYCLQDADQVKLVRILGGG